MSGKPQVGIMCGFIFAIIDKYCRIVRAFFAQAREGTPGFGGHFELRAAGMIPGREIILENPCLDAATRKD